MTSSTRYTLLFAFLLSLVSVSLPAQTPIDEASRTADTRPAFPGCDPLKIDDCSKTKLDKFISDNLKIPAEAITQGAGGVVMVEFVVEKNGKIGEVKTLHDPGYGLGTEAIRVIKLMAEKKMVWTPARENDKKIPFRYMTPVPFNLSAPPKEARKMTPEITVGSPIYEVAEVMPRFAGCDHVAADSINCTFAAVLKHIQTNLQYPQEALTNRAQGPVVVDFVIDTSGRVTVPVVTKGLGFGCDQEALRVISIMPPWIPGMQDGKPVAVKMTIPILFQIPKEKD